MNFAPIALFIYNRPEHTRRTLDALMQCAEFAHSPLYVFCDGPKNAEDENRVHMARTVVRSIVGSHGEFIESETNRGLAHSIMTGVGRLCHAHERVIAVEDDLLVSRHFLGFLNRALDRYEHETKVMQVSAYMFPIADFIQCTEAFFLPFTSSWGWATWRRAWELFDAQASGWDVLKKDRLLRHRFNLDGAYDYFTMMKKQMSGASDSWAIRWYWSVFVAGGLVLFPPQSYVRNIGFDGSGTHGWRSARYLMGKECSAQPDEPQLPASIMVHEEAYHRVKQLFVAVNKTPYNRLRRLLSRFRQI